MQTLKKLCAIVLMTLLLITSVAGCQQPTPTPAPRPTPPPPFEARVVPEEAHYLLGQVVELKLLVRNTSAGAITMKPYPPEIKVKPLSNSDQILFSAAPGTQSVEIKPNDTITVNFSWDQKDKDGKQVPPGWYNIIFTNTAFSQGDRTIGINLPARVLIQYPQGVIEKTIEVNESRTANDITVTLERVELTSGEMKVYAFVTQPDYPPTVRSSPFWKAATEYRIDGGAPVILPHTMMDHFENGTRFIWGGWTPKGTLDPVPSDSHELIFKINSMQVNASPDDPHSVEDQDDPKYTVEGPWEFKIPLE